jgi:hypothetical protein
MCEGAVADIEQLARASVICAGLPAGEQEGSDSAGREATTLNGDKRTSWSLAERSEVQKAYCAANMT